MYNIITLFVIIALDGFLEQKTQVYVVTLFMYGCMKG